jgi:ABC-type nickel/cobalt efflux system permease component RcnA
MALSEDRRGARRAGALGLTWGLGHATTLLAFGLPALLLRRYLPEPAQQAAEAAVGIVIIALALRLLTRWRRGYFHSHPHRHGGRWHTHPHVHAGGVQHELDHEHRHTETLARSPLTAYGIGLIHGMGGSAGVTLLLIAAMPGRVEATVALLIFALATAVSMCALSAAFGTVIATRVLTARLERAVPLLGLFSLAFGAFYLATAL